MKGTSLWTIYQYLNNQPQHEKQPLTSTRPTQRRAIQTQKANRQTFQRTCLTLPTRRTTMTKTKKPRPKNQAHDHIHYTASGGHCGTKTRSLLHILSQPKSFPMSITMVTKSDTQKITQSIPRAPQPAGNERWLRLRW
jgi:hypothetical protein